MSGWKDNVEHPLLTVLLGSAECSKSCEHRNLRGDTYADVAEGDFSTPPLVWGGEKLI